jgi:hypothetical protein
MLGRLSGGERLSTAMRPATFTGFEEGWEPVSKWPLLAWLTFYTWFLFYAAFNRTGFLFIDFVNLPIHEGGHLLFGWFGQTIGVAGGTLLQLLAPAMLALYFMYQRQPTGTAFCGFFFFENFLNISTYMADARAQQLCLVTVGDGENGIHDWFFLFSKLGVLEHDTAIAHVVRVLGWLGMIGTVLWLARRSPRRTRP